MTPTPDSRILLAAERTLLAWNRTSVSLMALGFVIERFGLFIKIIIKQELHFLHRDYSFYIGIIFILLAVLASISSILQYRKIIQTLSKDAIPKGYNIWFVTMINSIVAILGIILIYYLYLGFTANH